MTEIITVLLALAIIGAIVAVESTRLLFSVISIGAVGFLVAIVFLFLSAPDIAIVQIGVEIVSLVILIRATVGREAEPDTGHRAFVGMVAAVTLVVIVSLLGVRVFTEFPEFGSAVMDRFAEAPSASYLRDGLAHTGSPNIVAAVLLDFRGYDTLGEATVLFCAMLGALTVLRRKARSKSTSEQTETDST